jgi:hypothetical protein
MRIPPKGFQYSRADSIPLLDGPSRTMRLIAPTGAASDLRGNVLLPHRLIRLLWRVQGCPPLPSWLLGPGHTIGLALSLEGDNASLTRRNYFDHFARFGSILFRWGSWPQCSKKLFFCLLAQCFFGEPTVALTSAITAPSKKFFAQQL